MASSESEYIGPMSAIVGSGSYACDVREDDPLTEIFTNGVVMAEVPRSRVTTSVPLPDDARPFSEMTCRGGGYMVKLDPGDHLEVFDGSYIDDQGQKVIVRAHVGAAYAVPSSRIKNGCVRLMTTGIIPHKIM